MFYPDHQIGVHFDQSKNVSIRQNQSEPCIKQPLLSRVRKSVMDIATGKKGEKGGGKDVDDFVHTRIITKGSKKPLTFHAVYKDKKKSIYERIQKRFNSVVRSAARKFSIDKLTDRASLSEWTEWKPKTADEKAMQKEFAQQLKDIELDEAKAHNLSNLIALFYHIMLEKDWTVIFERLENILENMVIFILKVLEVFFSLFRISIIIRRLHFNDHSVRLLILLLRNVNSLQLAKFTQTNNASRR